MIVSWSPHRIVAAAAAACAVTAGALAAVTTLFPHRMWGVLAALGYAAAAVVALRTRDVLAAVRTAAVGAALLPAAMLIATGERQPEVDVVEDSARTLLATGSPYLAAPTQVYEINPYLPGMTVFGLPRRLLGDSLLADARVWFVLVSALALAAALRLASGRSNPTVLWALAAVPLVALPVAVGGHDLPVIALMCLGLAYAAHRRPDAAGVALGVAAILKQSAWPGVAVGVALVVVLAGAAAARRCAMVAGAIVAVALAPMAFGAYGPTALAQMAGFPLGGGAFASPAAGFTPGVLLAHGGPTARLAGLLLLAAAVVGLGVWLLRRPPRSLAAAAVFVAVAQFVAMLVLPASREGYLVYPLVLLVLAAVARRAQDFDHDHLTPAPAVPAVAGRRDLQRP